MYYVCEYSTPGELLTKFSWAYTERG
jgi:hypothetical protein